SDGYGSSATGPRAENGTGAKGQSATRKGRRVSEEIVLQRDVTQAGRAQALLDDKVLAEAFTLLEQGYIDAWRATKTDGGPDRERLFLAVNVIGKVREHLHLLVSSGSIARIELERLYAETERKKKLGIF